MQQLGLSSRGAPKEESRVRSLLWPTLSGLPGIESAIDIGKIASFAVAVITSIAAVVGWVPKGALFDAILFAGLGVGIARKSRVCAVLALVLYVIGQVMAFWQGVMSWNVLLLIILASIFINAVRATYAYHERVKTSITPAAN